MGPLIIRDITKPPTQAFLGVRHAFLAIENVALVKRASLTSSWLKKTASIKLVFKKKRRLPFNFLKYSETSIKRTPSGPSQVHVRLIEGVRLIKVIKIAQCLLTINIQLLLCTVIKLYDVKEAIQSSSSLPFITKP